MKRWLAFFFAMILCVANFAIAEDPAAAPQTIAAPEPVEKFSASLFKWASGLNPAEYDLHAAISADRKSYSATLKHDGAVTSIEIPGIGALQIDQKDIVLNVSGMTYVMNIESLVRLFADAAQPSGGSRTDTSLIRPLLQQAVQEILLPSVELSYSFSTINCHIALNETELRDRSVAFIDKLIASDSFEPLYAAYGQYFQLLIPDFPKSADDIRAAWPDIEAQSHYPISDHFSIEADFQRSLSSWGAPEIACVGNIFCMYRSIGFSFEYSARRDGFSLCASLSERTGNYDAFNVSFALDGFDQNIAGSLTVNTYESNAFLFKAAFRNDSIDAEIDYRQNNRLMGTVHVNGTHDRTSKTITGKIDYTDRQYDDGQTVHVASLDLSYWASGCTGNLSVPGAYFQIHSTMGNSYAHTALTAQLDSWYGSQECFELWLFKSGWNSYRARFEILRQAYGNQYREFFLTGTSGPTGFSASVSGRLAQTQISGSVNYERKPDGFDFSVEYNPDALYFSQYTGMERIPFSIRISRTGKTYDISFTNTFYPYSLKAKTQIVLGETGNIALLDGAYENTYYYSDESQKGSVSYRPGTLKVNDGHRTYTVQKKAETARAIRYQMTVEPYNAAYTLDIELDKDLRTLVCRVSSGGVAQAEIQISALDKTEIEPLSKSFAIPVSPRMLVGILRHALPADTIHEPAQTYEPSAEEAPAYDDEADAEAVEDYAYAEEAAEEAVKRAAETVEAAENP